MTTKSTPTETQPSAEHGTHEPDDEVRIPLRWVVIFTLAAIVGLGAGAVAGLKTGISVAPTTGQGAAIAIGIAAGLVAAIIAMLGMIASLNKLISRD